MLTLQKEIRLGGSGSFCLINNLWMKNNFLPYNVQEIDKDFID